MNSEPSQQDVLPQPSASSQQVSSGLSTSAPTEPAPMLVPSTRSASEPDPCEAPQVPQASQAMGEAPQAPLTSQAPQVPPTSQDAQIPLISQTSSARKNRSNDVICGMARSRFVAQAGVIAALYAAATLIVLVLLQGLAWGPVQFRISEAVCVVAALTPAAVPGLTAGCAIANLFNIVFGGTGALGLLDVVFGSCATLLGSLFCWKMRRRPAVALAGMVVANAVIVPAYLPILLQGLGYYTVPFTNIALDGLYGAMYLFGLVATAIGEAFVMYVLGWPLLTALKRAGLEEMAS